MRQIACILILFPKLLFSWFTGPLIVQNAEVVPKGMTQWEPYWFQFWVDGTYNKHWNFENQITLRSSNLQLCVTHGLVKGVDIELLTQAFINSRGTSTSTRFGDTTLFLGFQLLEDRPGSWEPALRFTIQETFPTGQYDKLGKHRTEDAGAGSFQTGVTFNFLKRFNVSLDHTFNLFWSVGYTVFSPTNLCGRNVYGGDPTTQGRVYPGNLLQAILSFEYDLTRHFAIAADFVNTWRDHDNFSGITLEPSKRQSGYNFSMAPALEYNFTKNFGIIAGSWFSLAGRNTIAFSSLVVALNIIH